MTNAVWEYLNMAFPPHIPTVQHVVITSPADNQLSLRTGISATIIPNVMDFENPPLMHGRFESYGKAQLRNSPKILFLFGSALHFPPSFAFNLLSYL
jgi:hypothetical protein